jgi:hypothetical protein
MCMSGCPISLGISATQTTYLCLPRLCVQLMMLKGDMKNAKRRAQKFLSEVICFETWRQTRRLACSILYSLERQLRVTCSLDEGSSWPCNLGWGSSLWPVAYRLRKLIVTCSLDQCSSEWPIAWIMGAQSDLKPGLRQLRVTYSLDWGSSEWPIAWIEAAHSDL